MKPFVKRLSLSALPCLMLMTGACASQHAAAISDNELARVPPGDLAGVNQERLNLARARDDLARRKLDVQSADNEVNVAVAEKKAAVAQLDADQKAINSAGFDRDAQAHNRATRRQARGQDSLDLAQAREQSARARLFWAERRVDESTAQVDLAAAKLDAAKYRAVQRSGDPVARDLSPGPFERKVADARANADRAQDRSRNAELQFRSAENHWASMRQRLNGERATGGSGF